MPLADIIQRLIHFMDAGKGPRFFRVLIIGLVVLAVGLRYDYCHFSNLSTPEAMDSAQLARNISEGRGYTTDFIRPFSMALVYKWNEANRTNQPGQVDADPARLQNHPDLQNAPVYPLFLAGLMKVLPFHPVMEFKKTFWSEGGHFARYEPDFLIALANQALMLVVVWQTFLIARKLFDPELAWVTAILVFGCECLWQFSIAGLPTMLAIVIFLGITQVLIAFEEAVRAPAPSRHKITALAIAAGLLTGAGSLTLYSFGWLIVPVVFCLGLNGGVDRVRLGLAAVVTFFVVLTPWVIRNYLVSGTPFGTAGFSVMSGDYEFQGFKLEQSLHPDLTVGWFIHPYLNKLWPNLGDILANEIPRMGMSWAAILFMAGLLMPFRGRPVRRLRYFILMCLGTLIFVQAMGKTQLSFVSPSVNSENLLVIVLPLVLMYGTVFFFTCMEQFKAPGMLFPEHFRYGLIIVFLTVMSLPFLGRLLTKGSPITYPPYYPPEIQMLSSWMEPDELMLSDVPWAVAWYGHHSCIWLTLNDEDEYYALNHFVRPMREPIHALYLTPVTMDARLFTDCIRTAPSSWNNLALKLLTGGDTAFPLRTASPPGLINSGIFLTDKPRWLGKVP